MNSKEAFAKIYHPEEREALLQDLCAARGEILCKGSTDSILKLKSYAIENDRLLCLIQKDSPKPAMTHEDVIASFHLGGEKYFFQSTAIYDRGEIFFVTNFDIFHLQRRQNYRVKIPASYRAHLDVTVINGTKAKMSGKLYDVSSGGCRASLHMTKPLLKLGDTLTAQVVVGLREPIEVEATVRHAQPDPTAKDAQLFGLEFLPLSSALETRMFAITMDLHRELFSKLSIG